MHWDMQYTTSTLQPESESQYQTNPSIALSGHGSGHSTTRKQVQRSLQPRGHKVKETKIIQKHDFRGQNVETSSDNKHRSTRSVQDTCDGFQENQTVCRARWTMKQTPNQACSESTELFGFCRTFCQSDTGDSSAHKRNAGHECTYRRVGRVPCQDPLRVSLKGM